MGQIEYKAKYLVYSENSGNHIISLCYDGSYQCDCLGWTRHFPRINCKHIRYVVENKPEPLNKANWDKLNGRKKKTMEAIDKMIKAEYQNMPTNEIYDRLKGI